MRIKGLKISEELCLVRLSGKAPADRLLKAFCGLLADGRINTPFMTTACRPGGLQVDCCVAAADQAGLERRASVEPALSACLSFRPGVGLLTLFPHRASLEVLGRLQAVLAENRIPVFGLASSIGALTCALAYDCLDAAAAAVQTCFELEDNHAPFRAEFTVSQATRRHPGGRE